MGMSHKPAQGSLRLPGPERLRGEKAGVGCGGGAKPPGAPGPGPPLVCTADLSATPAAAGKASAADTW